MQTIRGVISLCVGISGPLLAHIFPRRHSIVNHEISPKVQLCHSGSVNTINECQMIQLILRGVSSVFSRGFSPYCPEAHASTRSPYHIGGQSQPLSHKQASQAQDFPPFVDKEDAAWRKSGAVWEGGHSHPPGLAMTHSLRVLQFQDAYTSSIKAS